MIKLKEEELLKAKAAAKKDVKDPMKKKSTAEVKGGDFPPRTAANTLRPSRDVDISSLLPALFFMSFQSAGTLKTSPPNKDHPGQPPPSTEGAPQSPVPPAQEPLNKVLR